MFDELGQAVGDVTVTGRLLASDRFINGSDTLTTTTQTGVFTLNGAPTGQTVLVTVGKPGFTTRQQTIVPFPNWEGDPKANTLDFGNNTVGEQTFSMTDMPEVSTMSPKADASGVDPAGPFTLAFSEAVNTGDVEANIAISVASGVAAKTYPMSSRGVVLGKPNGMYNATFDAFRSTGRSGEGGPTITNDALVDGSFLSFSWSNNNQVVTAAFKPGYKLPTDKDSSKLPHYAVGFRGAIRDASGKRRPNRFFRVSPAQIGKNGSTFTVAADTTAPRLIGIVALDNVPRQGGADTIRFQFSETMVLYPDTGAMQSGDRIPTNSANGGSDDSDPLTIINYRAETQTSIGSGPSSLAMIDAYRGATGTLQVTDSDIPQAVIEIATGVGNLWGTGTTVWGGVAATIEDPAGNAIETQGNGNIRSATSI